MSKPSTLSRREALSWISRAAVGLGVAGCGSIFADDRSRFGWEAAATIPPGPYRAQIWQPPGQHTAPIFVVVLVNPGVAPVRIIEPYEVVDLGEVSPATVVANLHARYPGLLPNGVEVEALVAGKEEIGHIIRTQNIIVYAYLDRSLAEYSVKLSGVGKYRRKGGGTGR
jgi:hypothetical protein